MMTQPAGVRHRGLRHQQARRRRRAAQPGVEGGRGRPCPRAHRAGARRRRRRRCSRCSGERLGAAHVTDLDDQRRRSPRLRPHDRGPVAGSAHDDRRGRARVQLGHDRAAEGGAPHASLDRPRHRALGATRSGSGPTIGSRSRRRRRTSSACSTCWRRRGRRDACACTARFDLDEVLRRIETDRMTLEMAVAPIALAMANHPRLEDYDLSSLRYIMWGATPVSEQRRRASSPNAPACAGCPAYGASEVPVIAAQPGRPTRARGGSIPPASRRPASSCGWPISTPARCSRPGEIGEIQVRSPSVMAGYLPDEANADAFADGWYRTGDVGWLEPEGWVHLTDRSKEMIKVNGFQVAPAEVEAVLHGHPGGARLRGVRPRRRAGRRGAGRRRAARSRPSGRRRRARAARRRFARDLQAPAPRRGRRRHPAAAVGQGAAPHAARRVDAVAARREATLADGRPPLCRAAGAARLGRAGRRSARAHGRSRSSTTPSGPTKLDAAVAASGWRELRAPRTTARRWRRRWRRRSSPRSSAGAWPTHRSSGRRWPPSCDGSPARRRRRSRETVALGARPRARLGRRGGARPDRSPSTPRRRPRSCWCRPAARLGAGRARPSRPATRRSDPTVGRPSTRRRRTPRRRRRPAARRTTTSPAGRRSGSRSTCADLVGTMRGAVAARRSTTPSARRQYGVAVGSFQAVQHLLADALRGDGGLAKRQRCTRRGRSTRSTPADALAAAAVAKAYCARAARTVCETAIQVHGGIGNTWECLAHVYLRRALLSIDLLGGVGPSLDAGARAPRDRSR